MAGKRERRALRRAAKAIAMEEALEKQRRTDEKYMRQAMKQAQKAETLGEVPIGCVIVHDGRVIGRGYNRRNTDHSTFSHAEITAMKKACRVLGDWRLEDCTLYVTLEPCSMCAGAIIQARIPRVVMACGNPKGGCAGSVINVLEEKGFNHQAEVVRGVLEEECSRMLSDFFSALRKRLKTSDGSGAASL